jgi:hypothetical protein
MPFCSGISSASYRLSKRVAERPGGPQAAWPRCPYPGPPWVEGRARQAELAGRAILKPQTALNIGVGKRAASARAFARKPESVSPRLAGGSTKPHPKNPPRR